MESPSKRPRLNYSPEAPEEPDEIDLQQARAQNDLRLKSIFEGIFEKYGKDFADVGDEIDLNTGDIVVDHGHLFTMEGEDDTGEKDDEDDGWLFDADSVTSTTPHKPGLTVKSLTDYMAAEMASDVPSHDGSSSIEGDAPVTRQSTPVEAWEEGDEAAVDAGPDGESDRSSIDAAMGIAMSGQNNDRDGAVNPVQEAEPSLTVTEKAKPAAGTSTQSQIRPSEPVESIWRVPEIDADFSTPVLSRPRPNASFSAVRSASPPEAGSLWALPWKKLRRNTDVSKRKSTKKARTSKKPHSSPVVYDWSFAETPDGSESDDPLQDGPQPSPTPKGAITIRGKRMASGNPARTTDRCDSCNETFSRGEYIAHLRAVIASESQDGQHDVAEARRKLDTGLNGDDGQTRQPVTSSTPASIVPSVESDGPNVDSNNNFTPTRRARTAFTLDEARLIVTMRHVQGRPWKEITEHLPGRNVSSLANWIRIHWTDRIANPPRNSGPWSELEQQTLDRLQGQQGLLWPEVRVALPGRLWAEIEFELLQRWAGTTPSGVANKNSG